ncbi:MAG: C-GCAxxG-C-C family protein [Candidatus Bathyarchaeia archaeon]
MTRATAPDEGLIEKAAKAAHDYDKAYMGCCRCTLAALQETLGLGDGEALRASFPLSGGIARMGETCGALVGALMAVGLAAGSDRLDDRKSYDECMALGREVYERFKAEHGSSLCYGIQERLFGRHFDLKRPEEAEAWRRAGGREKCPLVCASAARIAADVILRFRASKGMAQGAPSQTRSS